MPTKQLNTGKLFRTFDLDRAAIDADARTVPLSFSSEEPYARWFGIEVLDHSPTSVRLERIKRKGPLLVDHDTRDQVGVIEDVQIATDKVGRAVVRFGQSARAQEIYQDVVDGIRANVSVGYMVHRMTLEDPTAATEVYRATDWEPLEISIVSVPADTTVGIGRSDSDGSDHTTVIDLPDTKTDPATPIQEKKTMSEKIEVKDNAPDPKAILAGEQRRVAELLALAEQHNMQKDVREFIANDKSAADFMRHILGQQRAKIISADKPTELDLTAKELQRYSLFNAIRASVNGDWKGAEFERECSLSISQKLGRDARGFFVPFDVQTRTALTAGTADTGAQMVGTDHLAGSFIDALIAEAVIGRLGATFLPGLVGDVDIPAMGAATFYWLTEDANVTDSIPATRAVALSPKTVGGAVPMSRRFLKQSSPAAEGVVERLLRRGAAAAIDRGMIQGTGLTGQPTGIVATTGVNTQSVAAAGNPTWAETVGFETNIATDNALMGRLSYLVNPTVRGAMKVRAKDTGSGLFVWDNNLVNGYSAEASNNVPANGIIFGNFEDLYVGLWGVLDVQADVATKAASGGLVLRVFQDVDCGIGNAESFCIPA